MTRTVKDLYSDRARAVLDDYFPFPEPQIPVKYNFDQGTPAPEMYPLDDIKEYIRKAVDMDGTLTCEYFGGAGYEEMTYGYAGLRSTIAQRTERRIGRPVTRANVMLTNGSAHGLSLVANAFLGPDSGAVVEALSFPFMVDYMGRTGATIETVAVDAEGMVVDDVAEALQRLVDAGVTPKMIYTIPSYQVPTGTTMPLERRQRLVEIAHEWGVLLVEDSCYQDLYFDEPPPASLLELDHDGRVVQSDSFSKTMAPGLRLGWVTGSEDAMAAVAAVREDLGVSQLIAHAIDRYLNDGKLEERLEVLRPLYKSKRDLSLDALRRYCGDNVSFVIPQGGIYYWLEIDPAIDCAKVSELLADQGVACRPGERFSDDPSAAQFIRLAFLHVSEDEIERGIAALGEALEASRRS